MGNQQGRKALNDRTASAQGPGKGTVYSHGKTVGIEDYKNVNPGLWRKSTDDEVNTWNLPDGAEMHPVITSDGNRKQKILKKPSEPETIAITGNPTVTKNADGSTTYTFTGGSYTASRLTTIDKSQYEDNGNSQGASQVIRRLTAFGTSVRKPANPTKATRIYGRNVGSQVITPGSYGYFSPSSDNIYDCTTWAYYYEAPQYDYVGYFASTGSSGSGGTVKVTPSKPEETIDQLYDYYTHATGSAESETKTVLAQATVTPVQNFAFDGMDDLEEIYEI